MMKRDVRASRQVSFTGYCEIYNVRIRYMQLGHSLRVRLWGLTLHLDIFVVFLWLYSIHLQYRLEYNLLILLN